MAPTPRTALVTGATSGLGFEAAAQLADAGYEQVIATGRTAAKARVARDRLATRAGRNVFESLELDLDEIASAEAAAEALIERGGPLDTLVLNAGIAPGGTVDIGPDGFDRVISSSLIGHHVLIVRLIEAGLMADRASIVIAGSEAARGDVPMFTPLDVDAFATDYFGATSERPSRHRCGSHPRRCTSPAINTPRPRCSWPGGRPSSRAQARAVGHAQRHGPVLQDHAGHVP